MQSDGVSALHKLFDIIRVFVQHAVEPVEIPEEEGPFDVVSHHDFMGIQMLGRGIVPAGGIREFVVCGQRFCLEFRLLRILFRLE